MIHYPVEWRNKNISMHIVARMNIQTKMAVDFYFGLLNSVA